MAPIISKAFSDLCGGTTVVTDRWIRGAAFHSDRVRSGDAFFALAGSSHHGHDFAAEALARGASVVVSERPHPLGIRVDDPTETLLELGQYARNQLRGPVVAVTGSAGKTSTKAMMAAALDATATPANFNTPLPLACTLIGAWLGADSGRPLVLEVGIDRPGEMTELAELVRPSHAFVTLISASHLETLGSVERVGHEKAVLLRSARHRFASVQALDWLPEELIPTISSYGVAPDRATHVAELLATYPGSQRLALGPFEIDLPVPGRGMAANATAALVMAAELGLEPELVAARFAALELEGGRLAVDTVGGVLLLDDSYNSNPASALQALEVLRGLPEPQVAVLGAMLELGPHSRPLHRELGEATRGLYRVLAVGPEAQALLEGNTGAEYFGSTEEAVTAMKDLPRRGSVLFKASRGMRFETLVAAFREAVTAP